MFAGSFMRCRHACCPRATYAHEFGSALAPNEPSPATAAILWIERLAADPLAKQRSMRRLSKAIHDIRYISRWTVWLRGQSESPRQNSWITALFVPLT